MSMSEPTESVPPPKVNELGQVPLPDWKPPPLPPHGVIERRWARLEPLDAEKHAASIYRGVRMDPPLKRTVAATEAMYVMLSPYASSPSAPNPIDTDLLGRLLRSVMPFDERLYFAVV